MNEIKIPSIEFVRLKKGITEEELNDYMEENKNTHRDIVQIVVERL